MEVQGNSAAAIGNLSAKADDYQKFHDVWLQPEGGLHGYLVRFLESHDATFKHIAVWTIVQFLEGGDPKFTKAIKDSADILPLVKKLLAAEPGLLDGTGARHTGENGKADSSAGDKPQDHEDHHSHDGDGEVKPSDSISQYGSEEDYGETGEAEIPGLAKKILDVLEPDS